MNILSTYKEKLESFASNTNTNIEKELACFECENLEDSYNALIKLDASQARDYILEEICSYLIINYVSKIERTGMKLGLHRMETILKIFKNPEKDLKVIHIAGTNGKGSVSSYLTTTLGAKYKVGMYSSPGMISFNDRIRINNEFISYSEMYKLYLDVVTEWEKNNPNCSDNLSFFEILTVVALLYFSRNSVDFVVMEVGLGGRYDGTNIFDEKELSIITKIGLDHTAILGDTLEKIAYEKAGIVQGNDNVVIYHADNNVFNVIADVAKEKNAQLEMLKLEEIEIKEINEKYSIFSFRNYENIKIKMLGRHQIYNAALACLALDNLKERNIINLTQDEIISGLSDTMWPGRLEWVQDNILLDGAHNIDGVRSLVNYLTTIKDKSIKILLGILSDKDYKEMIEIFETVADDFYVTKVPLEIKESSSECLAQCFTKKVTVIENCYEALDCVKKNLTNNEILVVSGSLYLISALREKLV